jgi:hypothetical protein
MTMDAQGPPCDAVREQLDKRLRALQWMVGLSMAWQTLLIGAAVGRRREGGDGRRR